jgi:hypothetical protein
MDSTLTCDIILDNKIWPGKIFPVYYKIYQLSDNDVHGWTASAYLVHLSYGSITS